MTLKKPLFLFGLHIEFPAVPHASYEKQQSAAESNPFYPYFHHAF
jgi:hypothetical protein